MKILSKRLDGYFINIDGAMLYAHTATELMEVLYKCVDECLLWFNVDLSL